LTLWTAKRGAAHHITLRCQLNVATALAHLAQLGEALALYTLVCDAFAAEFKLDLTKAHGSQQTVRATLRPRCALLCGTVVVATRCSHHEGGLATDARHAAYRAPMRSAQRTARNAQRGCKGGLTRRGASHPPRCDAPAQTSLRARRLPSVEPQACRSDARGAVAGQ
jgi:hypothetical protein